MSDWRSAQTRQAELAEQRRATLRHELSRRMERPQRHRLLQGYPMAPVLLPAAAGFAPLSSARIDDARPLLIGVLPHAACNPRVRGCGFCTFPHEPFDNDRVRQVVRAVAEEVTRTATQRPGLLSRRVGAVYFGGGTANLTPPAEFQRLADILEATFDLSGCEVSLEGVPRYFEIHDGALLDTLSGMEVRHRRLSLGVQTFDRAWLARMGRDAFGDVDCVQRVVDGAHGRGMTVSADLLFNLPGRSLEGSLEDVRLARDLGFDQICLYNLVLSVDVDTEWADDEELIGGMRGNDSACEMWLALRDELLASGFVQTTLTNFEHREVPEPRRFSYGSYGLDPRTWDMLGFGPSAISTLLVPAVHGGLKWMNPDTSADYLAAMRERPHPIARFFEYTPEDLELLILTRHLARLSIQTSDLEPAYAAQARVLEEAGLLHRPDPGRVAPTPRGMYFADSIAGLLAWPRVAELRRHLEQGTDYRYHMG
jgi:coproporphyrinogen III oxidase-like Fe-S oxidoreductase